QQDYAFAGVLPWSPIIIILVSANRLGQSVTWAEEIDRARSAIIAREDCGFGALFRRKSVIDAGHSFDHLRPSELVREVLRECALHVGLGSGLLDAERVEVGNDLFR